MLVLVPYKLVPVAYRLVPPYRLAPPYRLVPVAYRLAPPYRLVPVPYRLVPPYRVVPVAYRLVTTYRGAPPYLLTLSPPSDRLSLAQTHHTIVTQLMQSSVRLLDCPWLQQQHRGIVESCIKTLALTGTGLPFSTSLSVSVSLSLSLSLSLSR